MKRSRALGGVLLLVAASGGLVTASASVPSAGSSGVAVAPLSFVPITPCRLVDTRPAPDTAGPRAAPIGPGETYAFAVRGTNGSCTVPPSAFAVALNVTAVAGTASSFLTVFPADVARPTTSNLNWTAGAPPTPNKVDVGLSADGRLAVYNLTGSVHAVVDVFGYYASGPVGTAGAGDATTVLGNRVPSGTSKVLKTTRFVTTRSGRLQIEADLTAYADCLVSGVPYIDYWLDVDGEFVAGSLVRRRGVAELDEIDLSGITTFTVAAGPHDLSVRASCDLVNPAITSSSGYDPPGITGLVTVLPPGEPG